MGLVCEPIGKVINLEEIKVSDVEFDENFNAITSHMERGEYSEALPLIKSSFNEKKCDVRLAMYYFYIQVHCNGLKQLPEILPFLNTLLTENWEKLSPLPKREQHTQKSLRWLFSRLNKMFEKANHAYKNKNMKPLEDLTEGLNPKGRELLSEAVTHLNGTLSEKWSQSSLGNQLMNVQKWFVDFHQLAASLNPQKQKEKKGDAKKEKEEDSSEESFKEEVEPQPRIESESSENSIIPRHALEPSKRLEELYQKIEAFQLLVKKSDYTKAAIIAADVDSQLENFDPLKYFPKLFVSYYSQYAKCSSKIEAEKEKNHTLLEKLFQADLESFLEWK